MGALASRRNAGVEEVDISTSNAYRYPPKSGCYFGSHFIMGGERFDTTQPETYLFGENQDLNFLGNRPVPFPYPAPQAHEPTKTLKSLVNIRKDSLRLVRVTDDSTNATETSPSPSSEGSATTDAENKDTTTDTAPASKLQYNIEFTFDSDVLCSITIYYFATEEITNGQVIYHPRDPSMNSETFRYKRGANQTFMQTTHIIEPDKFTEEDWQYNPDKDMIPIAIQCVVEDEAEHIGHSHITFATLEKGENGFCIKPLKQKQMVDGLCYLLQEIYGIENKNSERTKRMQDDEIDDSGSECVICMSDQRDTLILPCRHLCLCNCCADSLRYQANNCPICRAPFRALLQIRALRKKSPSLQSAQPPNSQSDDSSVSQEGVPQGYEAVPLIEALNGPNLPPLPPNPLQMPPEGLPPPMRVPHSLPTSPEESPVLDKRKSKRQSSVKGQRSSIRETCMMEEDQNGEKTKVHGTPVIAMAAHPDEPMKSPSDIESPRMTRKSSVGKEHKASTPNKESVEIVDEIGKKVEKERKMDKYAPESHQDEEDYDDEDDEVMESVMIGAAAALPTAESVLRSSPTTPYQDSFDEKKPDEIEVTFKPAAHTTVLYDPDDLEQPVDQDPLVVNLPSQVMDSVSLPGTPVSTTDGSSFSSTGSTRLLLTGQRSSADEEKLAQLSQNE